MVVSWLIFIAVALLIDAGFVKLAARLLRYSVSWKVSFLFAGIMMVAVIFHHVLLFSAPVAIRIGLGVVLLLGLVIVGGWFFSGRCANRQNAVLGWSGGIGLTALTFALMIAVAFAIAIPVQIFLPILFPPANGGRTPPTAFDTSCRQDLQFWLEQIT